MTSFSLNKLLTHIFCATHTNLFLPTYFVLPRRCCIFFLTFIELEAYFIVVQNWDIEICFHFYRISSIFYHYSALQFSSHFIKLTTYFFWHIFIKWNILNLLSWITFFFTLKHLFISTTQYNTVDFTILILNKQAIFQNYSQSCTLNSTIKNCGPT